jgi:magnesium transporter
MIEESDEQTGKELLEQVVDDLEAGRQESLSHSLEMVHPAEVADLLESLPPGPRSDLWEAIAADQEGEILSYLHEEVRAGIIEDMDHAELVAAAESLAPEDLAEIVETLPEDLTATLFQAMDQDYRQRVETVLTYTDGTAGRLLSTDAVSVRKDVSLAVVLRWLRRHQSLPPHTDALMVIDETGHYLGKLDVGDLLTGNPDLLVEAVMQSDTTTVLVDDSELEVATLFDRRDLISVAVLDEDERLLGRITIDDIVDVIRDESDRVLLNSAGLDAEEDMFAPVIPSAQRRGLWLGINLITVFAAAWVIGRFEAALDKLVALAVLMPVVASMGGIAGSQTLTLMIRGLALGQIAGSNIRWLFFKEILVGALNGVVWALVVALVAFLWFQNAGIAVIIACAMLLNLLAAAISGLSIPLILRRLGIDPALSGAVILTTVTDIVGFLSFLGLASLFLL